MSVETIERRILNVGAEVRVSLAEDGTKRITGYAAVFDSLSEDLGGFREIIKRGAFKESLSRGDDVRALIEHQGGLMTIGRRSSGTLRVKEDRHGLQYEVDLPDTQAGRDLEVLVTRGDITQSSFAFHTVNDEWKTVDGEERRILKQADVRDVSPVTFPAYPDTDVSVAQRSFKAWKDVQVREGDIRLAAAVDETVLSQVPLSVLKAKCDLAEAE